MSNTLEIKALGQLLQWFLCFCFHPKEFFIQVHFFLKHKVEKRPKCNILEILQFHISKKEDTLVRRLVFQVDILVNNACLLYAPNLLNVRSSEAALRNEGRYFFLSRPTR